MNWLHNDLADDLAKCKGTAYLDVPLGSVFLSNPQRADVLDIKPSYTRFCVTIYEIKISRADFLSDIRSCKWKGYLDHCHRFYFAVPKGMVKKEEIPDGAGLIVRGENGWSTLKHAKAMNTEIPYETMMSLIFSRGRDNSNLKRKLELKQMINCNERSKLYKKFSKDVADALRNKDEYLRAKNHFEYYINETKSLIGELIGLDKKASVWELSTYVDKLERQFSKEVKKDGAE